MGYEPPPVPQARTCCSEGFQPESEGIRRGLWCRKRLNGGLALSWQSGNIHCEPDFGSSGFTPKANRIVLELRRLMPSLKPQQVEKSERLEEIIT